MRIADRRETIRRRMDAAGIELLLAFHDGAHFIEKPNPVTVLSGFKSMGETMVELPRDGPATLWVVPSWDSERAADTAQGMRVKGVDDVAAAVRACLDSERVPATRIGVAGLAAMPSRIEGAIAAALPGTAQSVDAWLLQHARCKTAEEIAHARTATQIAERGYERLLQIARPGLREDELATELKWYMKTLGAEDNFLMLCAGAQHRAVQPPSGRRIARGDLILTEITPSYRGQLAQICRTIMIGEASATLQEKYALIVRALECGIGAARPNATMADVCRSINAVLEAAGYAEYCHPPHIRRRGHGLGFSSILPGDVSLDNATVLESGMFFVIHPNQYLPETGYLMCGEPVHIGPQGADVLTERRAALAEVRC